MLDIPAGRAEGRLLGLFQLYGWEMASRLATSDGCQSDRRGWTRFTGRQASRDRFYPFSPSALQNEMPNGGQPLDVAGEMYEIAVLPLT